MEPSKPCFDKPSISSACFSPRSTQRRPGFHCDLPKPDCPNRTRCLRFSCHAPTDFTRDKTTASQNSGGCGDHRDFGAAGDSGSGHSVAVVGSGSLTAITPSPTRPKNPPMYRPNAPMPVLAFAAGVARQSGRGSGPGGGVRGGRLVRSIMTYAHLAAQCRNSGASSNGAYRTGSR